MRARPRARRGRPGPLALDTEAWFAALEHAGFRATEHEVVTWDTHWDTDGIRALYGTFSPIARLDAERRDEILDVVAHIAEHEFGGRVERTLLTSIYTAASPTDPSRGHPYNSASWPPRTMLPVHEAPTCSVAGAAEIVGSEWTVLLVHDLSEGPRRFTELERSCAGISPRTLAERLRWLETGGIAARQSYSSRRRASSTR